MLLALSETEGALILAAGLLACFALAGFIIVSHSDRPAPRRAATGRRAYRFTTGARDTTPAAEPRPPELPRETARPRPGAAAHPSRREPPRPADLTATVVREALAGAREALRPATVVAKAAVRAAVATAAAQTARAPKALAAVKNTWRPDPRVSLAPNGFWIDASAAPAGHRLHFRWFDGRHAHDGAVIFAPDTRTGGHFIPTLTRPVAATLLAAERVS